LLSADAVYRFQAACGFDRGSLKNIGGFESKGSLKAGKPFFRLFFPTKNAARKSSGGVRMV
jgi:hypothetical protein